MQSERYYRIFGVDDLHLVDLINLVSETLLAEEDVLGITVIDDHRLSVAYMQESDEEKSVIIQFCD